MQIDEPAGRLSNFNSIKVRLKPPDALSQFEER